MLHIDKESLKNRVAMVTGAGSGIGRASAKILAHAGARVALVDWHPAQIEETSEEIRRSGGEAMALQADVSQSEELKKAVQDIETRWGSLHILHANAGINGVWAPFEEIKEEEWNRTLSINLTGTFLTIQAASRLLKVQGGSVILTGSINGVRIFSNTGATAYSCSKAAQVAMAKMLALEFAPHRVRVNIICPGAIESKINESMERRNLDSVRYPVEFPAGDVPLGHPGTSGQVAELVWFLASDIANHITGSEILIDGGQSLIQG